MGLINATTFLVSFKKNSETYLKINQFFIQFSTLRLSKYLENGLILLQIELKKRLISFLLENNNIAIKNKKYLLI